MSLGAVDRLKADSEEISRALDEFMKQRYSNRIILNNSSLNPFLTTRTAVSRAQDDALMSYNAELLDIGYVSEGETEEFDR